MENRTTRFALKPVICTNSETNREEFADMIEADQGSCAEKEAVDAVVREIISAALDICGDYETDSHFRNWHGGKYAHQSTMYGYTRIPGGVVSVDEIISTEYDDGEVDDEERRLPLDEYTDEHRAAITELEQAIEQAVKKEAERQNLQLEQD